MIHRLRNLRSITLFSATACLSVVCLLSGCVAVDYQQKRIHGQSLMANGTYGAARHFFMEAESIIPRRVSNLYDMGTCSMMLAKERLAEKNELAAKRELEAAISFYAQALEVYPGHQPSIEAKNSALELLGRFDEALEHAEWVAQYVGPAARQYLYLAAEHEERGDIDGALLRYKQAVAMEPDNPAAHTAFARFLLRTNNESAAVHHMKAAYRLDPTDAWTLNQLSSRGEVPAIEPVAKPSKGRSRSD